MVTVNLDSKNRACCIFFVLNLYYNSLLCTKQLNYDASIYSLECKS